MFPEPIWDRYSHATIHCDLCSRKLFSLANAYSNSMSRLKWLAFFPDVSSITIARQIIISKLIVVNNNNNPKSKILAVNGKRRYTPGDRSAIIMGAFREQKKTPKEHMVAKRVSIPASSSTSRICVPPPRIYIAVLHTVMSCACLCRTACYANSD